MLNANSFLSGFPLGTVPRKADQHFLNNELPLIICVAENLERELAAIKGEIAHIESRLKNVAENWDCGRSRS